MKKSVVLSGVVFLGSLVWGQAERKIWLDELDITSMTSAGELPQVNRTVNGNQFRIARQRFERGVGTHAESCYALSSNGEVLAFEAWVGVDMEEVNRGKGSATFRVYADGKVVADSGLIQVREPAKKITATLAGARTIVLEVSDGGDGFYFDHANWCEAFFVGTAKAELTPLATVPTKQWGILTPPAPAAPRINGARIYGARPGSPVLYQVPATGTAPLEYAAEGLPEGLVLDAASGILSGKVAQAGTYTIRFKVKNQQGTAQAVWQLEVGQKLALTPPMGWNSWNCFAGTVSDQAIRATAQALKASGLMEYGWAYVNIDDYWQNCPGEQEDTSLMGAPRAPDGTILPNARFPDMRQLCDDLHALGIKVGIYSSPGPLTCGGCVGSWEHEAQDARTYAQWGIDYLKYDWCSYAQISRGDTLKGLTQPYLLMGEALKAQSRDIVFSLCQYGLGHVSAWGGRVGGHSWRTTIDITDTWNSVRSIIEAQDGLELFAAPGCWNDPDMLVVGTVGWGRAKPTRLTPNEQYAHISMWCLWSAPLLIGCDLTKLDDFTLALLTNHEVLAINQDALGRQAARLQINDRQEVWGKPLSDRSWAVGIFNRSAMTQEVELDVLPELKGRAQLRDVWRQQDLGVYQDTYRTTLPGHAVLLLRISP